MIINAVGLICLPVNKNNPSAGLSIKKTIIFRRIEQLLHHRGGGGAAMRNRNISYLAYCQFHHDVIFFASIVS